MPKTKWEGAEDPTINRSLNIFRKKQHIQSYLVAVTVVAIMPTSRARYSSRWYGRQCRFGVALSYHLTYSTGRPIPYTVHIVPKAR